MIVGGAMPSVIAQTYRMVPVTDLEPHPENPHRGDVDVIAASIARNGFYGTVLVQQSRMRIIAGEHRWRGAKKHGLVEVPALIVDVDDDAATRIMLADNRTAEYGAYDDQALAELLRGLDDLDGTGWSDDDLNNLLADIDSGIAIVDDRPANPRTARPDDHDGIQEERPRPQPRIDLDDEEAEDDLDDDGTAEDDAPPPRPKAGVTADFLITLTAAEHTEMTTLLSRIRARDGDAPTTHIVLAALRTYAD
ncbi:ParB/RepB/Spo0J family partition protein [Streptosporangium sp. NPDC020072]|uniref:ParB/RepB/Spo0J family partition protein n=1 Tax=Streptosporangium sp. NPDC020072 TaxID=3154788 RepID=UPI003418564B